MYLQENSINLTYKGSKIIEYSGLSDGTYTDVNFNGIPRGFTTNWTSTPFV